MYQPPDFWFRNISYLNELIDGSLQLQEISTAIFYRRASLSEFNLNKSDFHNLIKAVKHDDIESIKLLLKQGVDVNEYNAQGFTPLCLAAMRGNSLIVQLLIDAGADVNRASLNGFMPLYLAMSSKHGKAAEVLRKAGAIKGKTLIDGLTENFLRINDRET